jgi:hypothetical protein
MLAVLPVDHDGNLLAQGAGAGGPLYAHCSSFAAGKSFLEFAFELPSWYSLLSRCSLCGV